jgi:uncharacterized membrane protein YobD (UPF0266 family)
LKKKRYFWQPELPIAIIYWSVTFFILFVGLIITLEHTTIFWKTFVGVGIFLIFVLIGLHRYFVVMPKGIKVVRATFLFSYFFPYEQIVEVKAGEKSIQFILADKKEYLFLMSKKSLARLLLDLEAQSPKKFRIKNSKTANLSKD